MPPMLFKDKKKKKFIETVLSRKLTISESPTRAIFDKIVPKCEVRLRAVTVFNRPGEKLVYDAELVGDLDAIKQAVARGDKSSLAQAKNLITAFDGKVKTALEKAKADAKKKVGSAELGPRHAFRVNVANVYVNRISAVDKVKGKELKDELDKVSTLPIDPKAAKSTYKNLGELLSKLRSLDQKVSGKAEGEVGDPGYKQVRKAAEVVLGKLRAAAPPVAVEKFDAQISNSAKRVALDAKNSGAEKTELEKHTKAAILVLGEFEKAQKDCDPLKSACGEIIRGMQGSVAPDVAVTYQSRWDSIEVLLGLHEYVKAKADMTGLISDFKTDPVVTSASEKKLLWNNVKGTVAANHQKLIAAMGRLPKSDPELSNAGLLLQKLLKAGDLGAANDFAGALAALPAGDWLKQVADLEARAGESEKLKDQRVKAQQDFSARRKTFEAEVKKFEDAGGDGTPYLARLDAVGREWESDRDGAQTGEALKDALAGVDKKLETQVLGIALVMKNGDRMEESKESREKRDERSAKDKILDGFEPPEGSTEKPTAGLKALLGELSAYDLDAVAGFNGRVEKARTADDLTTLTGEVEKALALKKKEMGTLRNPSLQKADTVEEEVKTRKGHSNKDAAPFFDGLARRVMAARGMLASPVKEVVEQGVKEIDAVEAALAKAKSESSKEQLATGFKEVKTFSNKLRADIQKHPALKKHAVSVQKDLLNQLTTRTQTAFGKPPKVALDDLKAFRDKEVKDAKDAADAIGKKHSALAERAKTLKEQAAAAVPEFLTKYRAALLARIDSAADAAEGGEDFADNQLDLIAAELKVCKGNDSYLIAQESRAENDELEKERRKKEWDGRVKVYKKFRAAAGNATGEIIVNKKTKSLLKTLDIQFSQAERFAKNGFFDQAEQGLAEAERTARRLLRNPRGEAASSCDTLPKVEKEFQAAVAAFVSQVAALGKAIEGALKEDPTALPPADATSIQKQLSVLGTSFNPKAFAAPVADAVNSKLDVAKRRTSREAALAGIRGYLELLRTDPLVSQIEFNPFKVRVDTASLKAKLANLNVNLMRCI